jgi:hypothetical protein
MNYQLIIVLTLFVLAIFFVGKKIYKSLNSNKECASNCGKCAADFSEIKIPESKIN